MKNLEKYKTINELVEAHKLYCVNQKNGCEQCKYNTREYGISYCGVAFAYDDYTE